MTNLVLFGQRVMITMLHLFFIACPSVNAMDKPTANGNNNKQVFETHQGIKKSQPLATHKTQKPIPSALNKIIVSKKNKIAIEQLDNTKARKINYAEDYLYILTNEELSSIPNEVKNNLKIDNEHNMLYLNTGRIDTSIKPPQINEPLKSTSLRNYDKQLYIIQFSGPILSQWREQLSKDFGMKIVDSLPKNAYLVWINLNQLERFNNSNKFSSLVQFITPYHPAYRISKSLQSTTNSSLIVNLRFYRHKEVRAVLDEALRKALTVIHKPYRQGDFSVLRITIDPASINDFARLPGLVSIERYYPKSVGDERQGRILSNQIVQDGSALPCDPDGDTACVSNGPGYLSWFNAIFPGASSGTDFQSFLIHFADTGIDRGDTVAANLHPDFLFEGTGGESRLTSVGRLSNLTATNTTTDALDVQGHGTMIASVIAGYANDISSGATAKQDASGYDLGLGIVPYARLASTRIFDCCTNGNLIDLNPNIPMLYENAYIANARISSNSWGDVGFGTSSYNTESQQVDLAVRDARPRAAQNQEMTIVFLAGNDGYDSSDGMYHTESLVNGGSVAKNAIVVGASENTNLDFSGCTTNGQAGLDVSNTWANDTRDTAFFTSRGPTSIASGSRNKPDLVAPGTRIQGAIPQAGYPNAGLSYCPGTGLYPNTPTQTEYHRRRGSSFSAPAVAGAVAMLKQIFINRKATDSDDIYTNVDTNVAIASPSPSPALNKAWLMNTTTYLTRPGYDVISGTIPWPGEIVGGEDLPSPIQGMGLLNIERALDTTPRIFRDQDPITRRFTDPLQSYTYSGEINPEIDFRVTLAWTDADSAGGALVNDLNLVVTIHREGPDLVFNGNNFTGAISKDCSTGCVIDSNNNVESVWIPSANLLPGDTFTVSISSATVMGDGFPNELSYDPTLNGGMNDPTDQDFALVIYNASIPAQNDILAITDDGINPNINAILTGNDIAAYTSAGDALTIIEIDTTGIDPRVTVNFSGGAVSYEVADSISSSDNFTTTFNYKVTDGYGARGSATATLNVIGTNDSPIANNDLSFVSDEDTSLNNMNLLSNDTDLEGNGTIDPSTVTLQMLPSNGIATVNPDGTVNYAPNLNFNGVDSFTYAVNDSSGDPATQTSNIATVSITINPVNDSPNAVDDLGLITNEDSTLNSINVLANDTDPEGNGTINPATVTLLTMPSNGVATVNPDGTVNYAPNLNINGADSFTYAVNDTSGDPATQTSNIATVSITINPVNDSPNAVDDLGLITDENTTLNNINVVANDTDPEGNETIDAATVTLVTMPSNGAATVNPDGTINYVPNLNTSGADSFTYTVDDTSGDPATQTSNVATVSITVNPAPDTDGDGVPDMTDNCPSLANSNQLDFDGDGAGDICDPDDDNDTLTDTFELANGLDPFDATGDNGANGDADGDGFTNAEEQTAGSDASVATGAASNPGLLAFSSSTNNISEDAGVASITITRAGGSVGAVDVTCFTNDIAEATTATEASDYTGLGVGALISWVDSDTTSKNCDIEIINDIDIELDEDIEIHLSNPSGSAKLGAINTALLTIKDNDSIAPVEAINDFNADVISDIPLYRGDTGGVRIWQMNGGSITANTFSGALGTNFKIAEMADTNADGNADVIWLDASTGAVRIWLMNGGTVLSDISVSTQGNPWSLIAVGDFNNDNQADILWNRADTGAVRLWLINNGTLESNTFIGSLPSNWEIRGLADVNNDNQQDIVWRNTSNSDIRVWQMAANTLTSNTFIGTFGDTNWTTSGFGDFNNDGTDDILFRNTSNGAVRVWEMNGSALQANQFVAVFPVEWTVQNVADYNADGSDDILWQNSNNGGMRLWPMQNSAFTTNAFVGTFADTNWILRGHGDYDGDNMTDIVWQNNTTGAVRMWLMNGPIIDSNLFIGAITPFVVVP